MSRNSAEIFFKKDVSYLFDKYCIPELEGEEDRDYELETDIIDTEAHKELRLESNEKDECQKLHQKRIIIMKIKDTKKEHNLVMFGEKTSVSKLAIDTGKYTNSIVTEQKLCSLKSLEDLGEVDTTYSR